MKTYSPKAKQIERAWYLVDGEGAVLGRLASEVAKVLRGKHKPAYAPHMDTGDHVIVTNAGKVRLSGEKEFKKIYYRHSQYPGGLHETPYERLAGRHPERVVEQAVRGMLPKSRLGRKMAGKLHVYAGAEHPHEAQGPVVLRLGDVPGAASGKG
jgi:large subunit ribosomal protein L13